MAYSPLTSALILINTSSAARDETTMAGSVEEVSKELRKEADEHIDLIHWLLGPNDMIVHVHASDFNELLQVINSRILPLKNIRHNRIASTETLIVTRSEARAPLSGLDERPKDLNAWVFANTNTGSPNLSSVMADKNIFYVGHVIGRYDLALLIRAETLPELMNAIDKTLRTKNFFTATDTRLVLM